MTTRSSLFFTAPAPTLDNKTVVRTERNDPLSLLAAAAHTDHPVSVLGGLACSPVVSLFGPSYFASPALHLLTEAVERDKEDRMQEGTQTGLATGQMETRKKGVVVTDNREINLQKENKAENSLPCGSCALLLCELCLTGEGLCHGRENNRTVCRDCCRNKKVIEISGMRVLVSSKRLNCKANQLRIFECDVQCAMKAASELAVPDKMTSDALRFVAVAEQGMETTCTWVASLFKLNMFYGEFAGTAHCFEVWDSQEVAIWESALEYSFIYVFISPVHAACALRLYPADLKPWIGIFDESLTNERVQFRTCSQCNAYAVRFPFYRTPNSSFLSQLAEEHHFEREEAAKQSLIPNFYSECLCLKPTPSHIKKYRGIRKKLLENNQSILAVADQKKNLKKLEISSVLPMGSQLTLNGPAKKGKSRNFAQSRVQDALRHLDDAHLAPSLYTAVGVKRKAQDIPLVPEILNSWEEGFVGKFASPAAPFAMDSPALALLSGASSSFVPSGNSNSFSTLPDALSRPKLTPMPFSIGFFSPNSSQLEIVKNMERLQKTPSAAWIDVPFAPLADLEDT